MSFSHQVSSIDEIAFHYVSQYVHLNVIWTSTPPPSPENDTFN